MVYIAGVTGISPDLLPGGGGMEDGVEERARSRRCCGLHISGIIPAQGMTDRREDSSMQLGDMKNLENVRRHRKDICEALEVEFNEDMIRVCIKSREF